MYKKAYTEFSNSGAKIWNESPAEIRESQSFDSYKIKLKAYMLSQYEQD